MRKKILLVEDDADARLLFTRILTNAGYDVKHGAEANTILTDPENVADLYILDNYMPNIDGIALTKFLKLKERTKQNPVLIISGNPAICNKAQRAGASGFLAKPFDVSYFLQTVNSLINDTTFKCFEVHSFEHSFI